MGGLYPFSTFTKGIAFTTQFCLVLYFGLLLHKKEKLVD